MGGGRCSVMVNLAEPDPPPQGGQSHPMGPQDLELIERERSRQMRDPPPRGPPPGAEGERRGGVNGGGGLGSGGG